MGDLDCNGVVDGSDLALFAANYGRVDCTEGPSVFIGSVRIGEEQIAYYGMSLSLSQITLIGDVSLTFKEGGILIGEFNMKVATGGVFPEVKIFFSGQELLRLNTVRVKSVKYIPPVRTVDLYLVEVVLEPSQIFFRPPSGGCPSGVPEELNFVQSVGYAGPVTLPDYIPISDFSFGMTTTSTTAGFYPIQIVSDLNEQSDCFFYLLNTGAHIPEMLIEKWDSVRDDGAESQIKLKSVLITEVLLFSTRSGGIEQRISFVYDEITWVHGNFVDGDWIDYSAGSVFGFRIGKNLGVFSEVTLQRYWDRNLKEIKVGLNYKL